MTNHTPTPPPDAEAEHEYTEVTLCNTCHTMTHTVCGKCKAEKLPTPKTLHDEVLNQSANGVLAQRLYKDANATTELATAASPDSVAATGAGQNATDTNSTTTPTPLPEGEEDRLIEEIGSLTVGDEPHQIRNFLGFKALGVIARWHATAIQRAELKKLQFLKLRSKQQDEPDLQQCIDEEIAELEGQLSQSQPSEEQPINQQKKD
jgi:hypothetical protein